MSYELYYSTSTSEIMFATKNEADSASWIFSTLNVNPTLNQWHHISVVRNSSNYILYLDGQLMGNETFSDEIRYTTAKTRLGIIQGPISANVFNGTLDNVQIWNRSLSETEIQMLYFSNIENTFPCASSIMQPTVGQCLSPKVCPIS